MFFHSALFYVPLAFSYKARNCHFAENFTNLINFHLFRVTETFHPSAVFCLSTIIRFSLSIIRELNLSANKHLCGAIFPPFTILSLNLSAMSPAIFFSSDLDSCHIVAFFTWDSERQACNKVERLHFFFLISQMLQFRIRFYGLSLCYLLAKDSRCIVIIRDTSTNKNDQFQTFPFLDEVVSKLHWSKLYYLSKKKILHHVQHPPICQLDFPQAVLGLPLISAISALPQHTLYQESPLLFFH